MKTKKVINVLLGALTVLSIASCSKQVENGLKPGSNSSDTKQSNSAKSLGGRFKVVGYFPAWGDVNRVQYSKLTHINYAFAIPDGGGNITIDNPNLLRQMVTNAHNNNVRALLAIGGGTANSTNAFNALSSNPQSRTNFVNAVMGAVNNYGLDGADIDWEYPVKGSTDNNYADLMLQLSTALHNSGKLLSTASTGSYGDYVQPRVFDYIDYLNIMAYDENPGQVGHSTYDVASRSLQHWIGLGLSPSKAVLGVPFYGKAVNNDALTYSQLLGRNANPYADEFQGYGYNGISTISAKADLVISRNAGGMMIWHLDGDADGQFSLLSVIAGKLGGAGAGNPSSQAPIGQTITLKGFNGLYVNGENGTMPMMCISNAAQGWEHFLVVDAGNGKIALKSQGMYVSSENGLQPITANRTQVQDWEKFDWVVNADGTVSFRGNNGKYISSENGTQAMTCNRQTIGGWEAFKVNN